MIEQYAAGKAGSAGTSGAETFVLGALHFWKGCRRARRPALPALHQRLASVGALMLAVPLDDFFRLCTIRRAGVSGLGKNFSMPNDAVVLSLLHDADERRMRLEGFNSEWTSKSLLLLSAWAVRRQIADEIGLRFGPVGGFRNYRRTAYGA